MKRLAAIALLALAACGADGDPERPEPPQRSSGPGVQIGLTGTAEMGISSR